MSNLSDRLYKARQFKYQVDGGPKLILIRPTMYEMIEVHTTGISHNDIAKRFTVGWESVKESDIIKGGASEEIPFDADAWAAWLDEHGTWWTPIGLAIAQSFNEHLERQAAAEKN